MGLLLMVSNSTTGGTVVAIPDLIKRVNPSLTKKQVSAIAYSIKKYSVAYGIDERIVAAVAAVESSFKPKAIGGLGEVGLLQLRPEFHAVHLPAEARKQYLMDIDNNIGTGAKYLAGLKTVFETRYSKLMWIEHYNRGPNAKTPKTYPYAKKVSSYYLAFGGTL